MMGNYQVRFLGDKGGAIRLRYPTKLFYNLDTMKKKKANNPYDCAEL